VRLGHEPFAELAPGLDPDLGSPPADVVTHRRIRQTICVVLVDQTGQHAPSRVALLARRHQVLAQHVVDRRLERLQPWRDPDRCLARWGDGAVQCLPDRPPMHPMLVGQFPDRQPLDPRVMSDRREQSTLVPTIRPPAVITNRFGDHRQVGPNQAVTTCPACRQVGPNQTVTAVPIEGQPGASSSRHGGANSGCHGQLMDLRCGQHRWHIDRQRSAEPSRTGRRRRRAFQRR
jgi:hypothetical protein